MRALWLGVAFTCIGVGFVACGGASAVSAIEDAPADHDPRRPDSSPSTTSEAGPIADGALPVDSGSPAADTLASNRDRLLDSYLVYLKATPGAQSNGLDGSTLGDVCDLWKKLTPSAQSVFLTITARLQGSRLAAGGASMLAHVVRLYRIAGGDGSSASDPGACGGDGNRLFFSMDATLHGSLNNANANKGGNGNQGKPDISDQPTGTFWRDSHDLGGTHAPFDRSDETDTDVPRGQVQFFGDPTSAAAKSALGRTDLGTLVDPLALEIDQDYDCVHNSNPLCSYTLYGNLCFPSASKLGSELYAAKYGGFDATWKPAACAGK